MKLDLRSPWAALVVAAFFAIPSLARATVDADVAEELLRKSGFWDQLGDIRPQALAGFDAALAAGKKPVPAEQRARLRSIFASAYEPTRLRAVALASFEAHVGADQVVELRAWYDSALGAKITALEVAQSAKQTTTAQVMKQGQDVLTGASANRRALLENIVQVTRSAETLTDVIISTSVGVRQGVLSVDPSSAGPSPAELRAALQRGRDQFVRKFSALMLASFAVTYESLDDAGLQRYRDFLGARVGAAFTASSIQAFEDALAESARALGRGLEETRSEKST